MTRKSFFTSCVGVWLLLSVGLKLQRYSTSSLGNDFRMAGIISDVLEKQDWKNITAPVPDQPVTLNIFRFKKNTCDKPLHITFINFGEATKQVLYSVLGSNIRFIYDGKISDHPPIKKQQFNALMISFFSLFQLNYSRESPIIVVAGYEPGQGCQADLVTTWGEMNKRFKAQ